MSMKIVVITEMNGYEFKKPKVFTGWIVDFLQPEYTGEQNRAKQMFEADAHSVVRSLESRGFKAQVQSLVAETFGKV